MCCQQSRTCSSQVASARQGVSLGVSAHAQRLADNGYKAGKMCIALLIVS